MEGSINQEKDKLIRKDCDRILRSYRAMNDVLLSSRSYGKTFGEEDTNIIFPDFVNVVREVTDDEAYKNLTLAKI